MGESEDELSDDVDEDEGGQEEKRDPEKFDRALPASHSVSPRQVRDVQTGAGEGGGHDIQTIGWVEESLELTSRVGQIGR